MAAVDLAAAVVSTAVAVLEAEASAAAEWEWAGVASVAPPSAAASVQPHCRQRDFAAALLPGTASAAPASTTDSGITDFRLPQQRSVSG